MSGGTRNGSRGPQPRNRRTGSFLPAERSRDGQPPPAALLGLTRTGPARSASDFLEMVQITAAKIMRVCWVQSNSRCANPKLEGLTKLAYMGADRTGEA